MRDVATEPVADERTPVHEAEPFRAERPPGRHRKPRPRRMLFAVGGLALAAGALSLMRLATEPPGGAGGGLTATDIEPADVEPTGIEPTAVGATEAPVSDTGAAAVEDTPAPRASPSTTTPPSSSNEPQRVSDPAVTPTATPSRTATPDHPTAAPKPAKPPAPEKPSTPTPEPPTATPHPGHPNLCLPIVSLCLDAPG
ncbi:hypothetical protein GCM10023080_072130 [Streptomyces pseudoechinosporeus]